MTIAEPLRLASGALVGEPQALGYGATPGVVGRASDLDVVLAKLAEGGVQHGTAGHGHEPLA